MHRASEACGGWRPTTTATRRARWAWGLGLLAAKVLVVGLLLQAAGVWAAVGSGAAGGAAAGCARPVFLTFDTGHMGVAPLVAEVLRRHEVKVTFFLANERTRSGGSSLDDEWAPWWRERVAEGHAFGSHTWDHWTLVPQKPAGAASQGDEAAAWRFRVTQGPRTGEVITANAAAYCEQLRKPAQRFQEMTGSTMGAVFRAPAGRTNPSLEAAARACGFEHVGWSPAGFLGDELSSDRYPNAALLSRALRDIRPGDILVAHLGIWSRQDPWAPAVLEPLIVGLKDRGLCFATLREHPRLGKAFALSTPASATPDRGTR